jgi:imidazolonepropionase-like amidohydrolase
MLIEVADHYRRLYPFDRSPMRRDTWPMSFIRLWNARAVDPASGEVLEHATIAVADGRIVEVAPASGPMPDGAIDVVGRTVLPGLVDVHFHLISDTSRSPGFGPSAPLRGEEPRARELGYLLLAKSCRAHLEAGITTVRDVGSMDDEAIVMWQAVELGLTAGPGIRSCGRIISATSPGSRIFGTMYTVADGPWAARRAVRENLQRGAHYVKLMATGARSVEREDPEPAQLTREEIAAVVDEAHRLGIRVAAHAEGLEGTRVAIEEGVDTIEHGLSLHRAPELLAEMAERGQVLVPTLSTFHDLAERFCDEFVPALVEQAKRQLDEVYRTLAAARDADVTMAMGFDSGPPGHSAWEIVRMAEGGLGSMGALAAATAGGGAALGMPDLGHLTVGSIADLVVVDGDPIADIRVLVRPSRIRLVIRDGAIVAGRDLDGPIVGAPPPVDDEPLAPPISAGSPCGCGR